MNDSDNKEPKPVYHFSDNFNTAYFGKLPEDIGGLKNPSTDQKLISNLISLLVDPSKKEEKTEALSIIRNAKAQQFLVDLIAMEQYSVHRKELVMACWETGLDFSEHLIFFADLASNCEYLVALEALTVIDEMHNIADSKNLEKAIQTLNDQSLSTDKQLLISSTLQHLRSMTALDGL